MLYLLPCLLIGVLPDALLDALPDAPPTLRGQPSPIAAHLEAVLPTPMTPAEAKAIDKRFIARQHWQLCPGSCGMLWCAIHGGGWKLEAGAADPADANQKPAPDAAPGGHWERRCGPGGCHQVWVVDPPSESAEAKPGAQEESSFSSRFRRRRR